MILIDITWCYWFYMITHDNTWHCKQSHDIAWYHMIPHDFNYMITHGITVWILSSNVFQPSKFKWTWLNFWEFPDGRTCLSTGQTDKNMLGPLESARGPKGPGLHHWWSSRTHALGGLAIEPLALYRPKQGYVRTQLSSWKQQARIFEYWSCIIAIWVVSQASVHCNFDAIKSPI